MSERPVFLLVWFVSLGFRKGGEDSGWSHGRGLAGSFSGGSGAWNAILFPRGHSAVKCGGDAQKMSPL